MTEEHWSRAETPSIGQRGQPRTNCNRSKLNWFCILNMSLVSKKKPIHSFSHVNRVKNVTFRYHHEIDWVYYKTNKKYASFWKLLIWVNGAWTNYICANLHKYHNRSKHWISQVKMSCHLALKDYKGKQMSTYGAVIQSFIQGPLNFQSTVTKLSGKKGCLIQPLFILPTFCLLHSPYPCLLSSLRLIPQEQSHVPSPKSHLCNNNE